MQENKKKFFLWTHCICIRSNLFSCIISLCSCSTVGDKSAAAGCPTCDGGIRSDTRAASQTSFSSRATSGLWFAVTNTFSCLRSDINCSVSLSAAVLRHLDRLPLLFDVCRSLAPVLLGCWRRFLSVVVARTMVNRSCGSDLPGELSRWISIVSCEELAVRVTGGRARSEATAVLRTFVETVGWVQRPGALGRVWVSNDTGWRKGSMALRGTANPPDMGTVRYNAPKSEWTWLVAGGCRWDIWL